MAAAVRAFDSRADHRDRGGGFIHGDNGH